MQQTPPRAIFPDTVLPERLLHAARTLSDAALSLYLLRQLVGLLAPAHSLQGGPLQDVIRMPCVRWCVSGLTHTQPSVFRWTPWVI